MICILAAAALWAAPAGFVPVSSSFPYGSDEFDALRDIHLSAYEPDVRWRKEWEEWRFTRGGVELAYGSISQRELYTERSIRVNVPLLPRPGAPAELPGGDSPLWFRYEREERDTFQLQTADDRVELQWRTAPLLWLTVSADPTYDKSRAGGGAGVLLSDRARTRYVDLRLQLDEIVFNERTHYDARYVHPPARLIGRWNLESEALRFAGWADVGVETRKTFSTPPGSEGIRDDRARRGVSEEKVEWSPAPLAIVGLRHQYLGSAESRRHFTGYVDPERILEDFDFAREQHRADVYGDWIHGAFRVRGQVGGLWEHERASFAFQPDVDYTRREALLGTRVHWRGLGHGIEIGAGYWAARIDARRTLDRTVAIPRPDPRPARRLSAYSDKVDAVFGWSLPGRVKAELLLSHEVSRERFGGGSFKGSVAF